METVLSGRATVTVVDDGYASGEQVRVTTVDGDGVGSGTLCIHSPWNATAYAGTVGAVKVKAGDELSAGARLMTLTDMGYGAAYQQLLSQRQEYEDIMLELFQMYQSETITAPCDGLVSGIDENSAQLLADQGQSYTITLLTNAPNGNDETLYANFAGQITAVAENGWVVNMDPEDLAIEDYLDLSDLALDTERMTQTVLHTQTTMPIYQAVDGAWTQIDSAAVTVGDILIFAMDERAELVWAVLVQKSPQPETPTEPTQTDKGSDAPSASEGTAQSGMVPSSGGWSGGTVQQEPEYELYSREVAQIATVTPQDTMTLEISIDELDITALQVGMAAQIKINALGGEKVDGVITAIGNTGTNSGGNSKYSVTLTLGRGTDMLSGMNAVASIPLHTTGETLTVPAEALAENGNETLVYTGYDAENDTLMDPVTVTTGVSDGEQVEILSGLTVGQTYYYAYYDTLETTPSTDFGRRGLFG